MTMERSGSGAVRCHPRILCVTVEDYYAKPNGEFRWLENWQRAVAGWDRINREIATAGLLTCPAPAKWLSL